MLISLLLVIVSVILLVAGCADTPATFELPDDLQASGENCERISAYVWLCEVYLSDGTLCAVTQINNYAAGTGISCDWK